MWETVCRTKSNLPITFRSIRRKPSKKFPWPSLKGLGGEEKRRGVSRPAEHRGELYPTSTFPDTKKVERDFFIQIPFVHLEKERERTVRVRAKL